MLAVPGLFAVTVAFCCVVLDVETDNAKLCDETQVTGMFVKVVFLESIAVATNACVPLFARLKGPVPPLLVAMDSDTSGQVVNFTAGLLLALAEA
jgi:hypothetical protein